MKTRISLLGALGVAVAIGGCTKLTETDKTNVPTGPTMTQPGDTPKPTSPTPGKLIDGPDAPLVTPPPIAEATERGRRRLDLDQLQQALIDATGHNWTADRGGAVVNRYDELADTLGKPDFAGITHEELAPTVMFQRFLDDAARSVCGQLIDSERTAASSDRVLFVHAASTDQFATASARIELNLQMLLLRFHGRDFAVGSDAMRPWMWLYQQAEAGSDTETAWNTVCVALITHPDFYTF